MDTPRLSELHESRGPFLTVYADVTRDTADGAREVEIGWKNHEAHLRDQGAPDEVIAEVGQRILEPTGLGGANARFVVATEDGILRDELLPWHPYDEAATWSPLPDTLAWLADRERLTPVLVTLVDHEGADFELHRAWPDEAAEQWRVDGESLHVHKVQNPRVSGGHRGGPGGESSQQPRNDLESRPEEVRRGNARAVAAELDRVAERAQLVALAGEPDACAEVIDHLGATAADRVVVLDSGGRANDGSDEALRRRVGEIVDRHLEDERERVLEEFRAASGRDRGAAAGVQDTLAATVRGQAATLLLDPGAAMTVHVRPDEVAGLELPGGVDPADQHRGDQVAIAAATRSGADVRVVREGALTADGIAALLRWAM